MITYSNTIFFSAEAAEKGARSLSFFNRPPSRFGRSQRIKSQRWIKLPPIDPDYARYWNPFTKKVYKNPADYNNRNYYG